VFGVVTDPPSRSSLIEDQPPDEPRTAYDSFHFESSVARNEPILKFPGIPLVVVVRDVFCHDRRKGRSSHSLFLDRPHEAFSKGVRD
jgi:hypothetical protein